MRTLLVIVGLRREALIAAGPRNRVIVGLRGLDESLQDVAAAISFGLCGGLSHALRPGDLVVGAGPGCDPAWGKALAARLPKSRPGPVVGSDRPVGSIREKAQLGAATGALAVDMETHGVMAAARSAGVPFMVLRAVCDPIDRELPRAALAGFGNDGRENVAATLFTLCRHPQELPGLLAVARDAGRAFRALRNARDLLGPGLGCPYLG